MATKNNGEAKVMNVKRLYDPAQEHIEKQYERQKRLEPIQRIQALSDDDVVVTLPWTWPNFPTHSLESYVAHRFSPVAFACFHGGKSPTDRIVTLWQPDKELALRINLSFEARMRCRSGKSSKTSSSDLFHIPQDPKHPHYPLRDAIAVLRKGLEIEIPKALREYAERYEMQRGKVMREKRAELPSLMLAKSDESSKDDEWETLDAAEDEEFLVVEVRDAEGKE